MKVFVKRLAAPLALFMLAAGTIATILFEFWIIIDHIPFPVQILVSYFMTFFSVRSLDAYWNQSGKPLFRRYSIGLFLITSALIIIAVSVYRHYGVFFLMAEALVLLPPIFLSGIRKTEKRNDRKLFAPAILSGSLYVLLAVFQWELLGRFVVLLFFLPLIQMGLAAFLLLLLALAIIQLVRMRPLTWRQAGTAPILALSLASTFLPTAEWDVRFFYWRHHRRMEEAVHLVKEGKIRLHLRLNTPLPRHLASSSRGGEIQIADREPLKIMFYTFRGVLDNFSGIVYSEDDSEPLAADFSAGEWQVTKLDKHWYFCGSR